VSFRNVLIADDEESMRHLLSVFLRDHGYVARAVANGEEALKELAARDYDLVLSDVRMPRMDGIALLREVQLQRPELTFIVMSAYGTHDTAIEAMKAGAYDYVSKPFKPDEVLLVLKKAEERERLTRENRRLRTELAAEYRFENLVGASDAMADVLRQVRKVAPIKTTVLLTGESGTGKELVARALHELSPRGAFPFVAVNCGAIPAELVESELFGHVKGAFTDATRNKKGLATEADGGTLFLDEVGELPLTLQAELLRVVQEGTYKRVGSNVWQQTSFRLVCATNKDLLAEAAADRFRRDFYYRIAAWRIDLPTLRDRREDIAPLTNHFLRQLSPDGEPYRLDEPVAEFLRRREYPGNVRDLRHLVTRACQRHVGPGPITLGDIPEEERGARDPADWRDDGFERTIRTALALGAGLKEITAAAADAAIRIAVLEEEGNLQRASRRLGVTPRALQLRRAAERQNGQPTGN
jgi:two-component system response regulator AtoC